MASDILQQTLRELRSIGASSETLEAAVKNFEQAKDDQSRRLAGEYLRGVLDQSIEFTHKHSHGEPNEKAIALYAALAAHVPADRAIS